MDNRQLKAFILSGGVAHDYAATSLLLQKILGDGGVSSVVSESLEPAENGSLNGYDLLVLNCVYFSCKGRPDLRDEWAKEVSPAARKGLETFLARGKGLLALHAATICFDDWPAYPGILGAYWEWNVSGHPPIMTFPVRVRSDAHPILSGTKDFEIHDELYSFPHIVDTIDPLMEASWEGRTQPLMWVRSHGPARVCYNALGHGPEAFGNPALQRLLQRGARWVGGAL